MKSKVPYVEAMYSDNDRGSVATQNSIKVDIFGTPYTIKGDADPEYITRVASFLNKKMADISAQLSSASPVNVALLTALNIADEYFQHKALCEREFNKVEEKTAKMIELLDQGIIGDIYP